MRILATILAGAMLASSAVADTETMTKETPMTPLMTGEVSLDFAETTNDNYGGTMNVDLDINAGEVATVDLGFKATDGDALKLDTWTVGMEVEGIGLAFGDDNGVLPETDANLATDGTLAKPAMTESLAVSVGDATVAVGLTDWNTDVTDVSNVQGAYALDFATVSLDYNMDSENTVLGAELAGIDAGVASLGGAMTYDMDAELFAYEGRVTNNGLSAYVNGDDTDRLQHVGGEYEYSLNGAILTAGVDYDTDAEEFAPSAGVSFNF